MKCCWTEAGCSTEEVVWIVAFEVAILMGFEACFGLCNGCVCRDGGV